MVRGGKGKESGEERSSYLPSTDEEGGALFQFFHFLLGYSSGKYGTNSNTPSPSVGIGSFSSNTISPLSKAGRGFK